MSAIPLFDKDILARFTVTGVAGVQVIDVPKSHEMFTVGREKLYGCHEILNDRRVSNPHFTLHYDSGKKQFFIENRSKTNGTLLISAIHNTKTQLPEGQLYPLQNGDTLRLTRGTPYIDLQFTSHYGQMRGSNTLIEVERDVNLDDDFNPVIPSGDFPEMSAFDPFINQLDALDDNRSATQVDSPNSTVVCTLRWAITRSGERYCNDPAR